MKNNHKVFCTACLLLILSLALGWLYQGCAHAQAGVNSLDLSLTAETTGDGTLTYTLTATVDPLAADSSVQSGAGTGIWGGVPDTFLYSDWCIPTQKQGAEFISFALNTWPAQVVAAKPAMIYAPVVPKVEVFQVTVPPTESYVFGSLAAGAPLPALPYYSGPTVKALGPVPTPGTSTVPPPSYQLQWMIYGPVNGEWTGPTTGDTSNSISYSWKVSAPAAAAPAVSQ